MLAFYLNLIDNEEDRSKFQMIYDLYFNSMLYTAYDILQDQYLAEDAVQEAFLQLAKHIKTVRTDNLKETKAYVVKITENCSLRMAQKNSKYIVMPEENTIEEIFADATDYESKTVNLVMYEEVKKPLQLLIQNILLLLFCRNRGIK